MFSFTSRPYLHSEILFAVDGGRSNTEMQHVYEPNDWFVGIIKAAHVLRRTRRGEYDRPKPLAEAPLAAIENEHTLRRVFRTIVNDSLDPSRDGFSARPNRPYEAVCDAAELQFSRVLSGLDKDTPRRSPFRLITQHDEPLLLQKGGQNNHSETKYTALSLKEIVVEGVRYPSGSIMGIHVERDYDARSGKYLPDFGTQHHEVVTSDELRGVEFLRPSLLTLEPDERRPYLEMREWKERKYMFPIDLGVLATFTIDQVVDLSRNVAE